MAWPRSTSTPVVIARNEDVALARRDPHGVDRYHRRHGMDRFADEAAAVHTRAQLARFVVELDLGLERAGQGIEGRRHAHDLAGEVPAGQGVELDPRVHADRDSHGIGFRERQEHTQPVHAHHGRDGAAGRADQGTRIQAPG
jgi:hypothetical protein